MTLSEYKEIKNYAHDNFKECFNYIRNWAEEKDFYKTLYGTLNFKIHLYHKNMDLLKKSIVDSMPENILKWLNR